MPNIDEDEIRTDPEPGAGAGAGDDLDYGGMADQLSRVISEGEQAGEPMHGLKQMRKALRRAAKSVDEAEQRGFERGRSEQLTSEARETLQAEFLQQLRNEDAHQRNVRRLGLPEELRSLFDALPADDFQAWQAKASELRSKGISWSTDPTAQQERRQVDQMQQAAAQVLLNGGQVDPDIFAALPAETRAQVVAAQTAGMQQAAAGGTPAGFEPPHEQRLQTMRRQGIAPQTHEQRQALADEVNRELDALARQRRGEW